MAPSPQDGDRPGAAQAVFHKDFRAGNFDPEVLQSVGRGVERDAKGLKLVLDADPDSPHQAGFDTAFPVRGDCEITVSYEVLGGDRPKTGYGVGVGLYAPIDPATQDAVSLARRLMPDGTVQFASDRMTPVDGKVRHQVKTLPSSSPEGKLRLERVGPTLRYLVADGPDAPFVPIEEVELGTADLCYVRVEGNAGGSEAALDARVLDFSVRAAGLPGLPDAGPAPGQAPTRTARRGWLAAAVLMTLLVVLAVLGQWLWARRRRRRQAPAPDNPLSAGAPAPLVSLACPGCGHGLKVKAELAGKRGKCPKCGKPVLVRGGAAGASAPTK
jgi:hypothetical protein